MGYRVVITGISLDYHLAGLVSASFVTLSMSGIALQLRQVLRRKQQCRKGGLAQGEVTASMSLNRFFASFFGFTPCWCTA